MNQALPATLTSNMADSHDDSPTARSPPPPPDPSADIGLAIEPEADDTMLPPTPPILNVFTLPPVSALKLLCAGIEALCRVTGDIPPTPPPDGPTTSNMRGMQIEKENIIRTYSMTDLSKMRDLKERQRPNTPSDDFDGISLKKPIISPMTERTEPYIIIGENAEPVNMQHSAITRKFYSKKPPPISLEDYLMRLHKFCPMTTGIYLAASIYIHRLAVEERAIAVTRRNCHRLVLGGLRVAMKALEDLSYPHRRFSKVGGVSESELARLEISFCFLTNFELRTTSEMMQEHASTLKHISACQGALGGVSFELRAPLRSRAIGLLSKEGKQQVTADA